MVFQALPRTQWALAGAKRLECGGLPPLCSYPQTTCLSPYRIFPISPMTGHATLFDPANRATEHAPVGCGEESPRSCRRITKNADGRERGRPRPHQSDDRPYDPFGSRKCGARTFTGWGCANNVSVPISPPEGLTHRLRQPGIGTRDNSLAMPQSGGKTQTTSLSLYLCPGWIYVNTGRYRLNQFICHGIRLPKDEVAMERPTLARQSKYRQRQAPVGHYDTACLAGLRRSRADPVISPPDQTKTPKALFR